MNDPSIHVRTLLSKAATAEKSEDAMRFSQAAMNAANAVAVLVHNALLNDKKD